MVARNSLPDSEIPVLWLKDRADFLKARSGARSHERAFVLQMRERTNDPDTGLRIGFTVTRKVGNAVERNRIKRRLREAVKRADLPSSCQNKDVVLIARRAALTLPFDLLVADVTHGMRHARSTSKKNNRGNRRVANHA